MTTRVRIIRPETSAFPPSPAACDAREVASVKGREAARLAEHRSQAHCLVTDAVAANPMEALAQAKRDLNKRLRKPSRSQLFAREWKRIVQRGDIEEICFVLRDTSDQTEPLRICHPFAAMAKMARA